MEVDDQPDPGGGASPVVSGAAGVTRAVEVLRSGGLVALPTETVYGLAADAEQPEAVAKIFAAKGRPAGHPLIVHLAPGAGLDGWAAAVPEAATRLADAFWPGPLTLLLRRGPRVADVVTGGRPTVGVRVPAHPVAQAVLVALDGGVAAPSANRFGKVSPTTAADVVAELGPAVDVVLDGGPSDVGVESTIVDLSGGAPVVRRPGGIPLEALADVLGATPEVADQVAAGAASAPAPGMLEAHYAPRAQVVVVAPEAVAEAAGEALAGARTVGLLAPASIVGLPDEVVELEPVGAPEGYARHLYARLRQADRLGLDVLLCVPPPATGLGVAVRDRLRRASVGSAR